MQERARCKSRIITNKEKLLDYVDNKKGNSIDIKCQK